MLQQLFCLKKQLLDIQVDYSEEAGNFSERVKGSKGERSVKYIRREDLDSSLFSSPKIRSKVDSGKGVRIQVLISLPSLHAMCTTEMTVALCALVQMGAPLVS